MVSKGHEFEDLLADSLSRWVGDNGVVLLRRQSFTTRRGSAQMGQECDILVDSRDRKYYTGFECKSINYEASNNDYGLYFSKYDPAQFENALEYAEKSGRGVYVAIEARNYNGNDKKAWLAPLQLFTVKNELGHSKVSWEDIEEYGEFIGTDGEYEINQKRLRHTLLNGVNIRKDFSKS